MKHSLIKFAAFGFMAFLIFISAIADRGEGDHWWFFIKQIPNGDKIGHLCLASVLSLLCNLAFQRAQPSYLPRWITRTSLIILVIFTIDETSQAFIPTRTCDFFDWLANLTGLFIGQFCALKMRRYLWNSNQEK